ncbi:MAG: hypothetical protein CVU46_11650 [Chloroflexi bacterium HGW-Chloroflexi-8]|nr:MAG: hypothetical protein CVU46_11650 [Chloroflexi bacterium HGW-Chloroflexi-8]
MNKQVGYLGKDKTFRANASQFFVAGELCRRGYSAVVTLGNTPNTDILCSIMEGTRFVHIQVKTLVPGNRTCSVGRKAEKDFGENFFWVLGGIPLPDSNSDFYYFIIPSHEMAIHVIEAYQFWSNSLGKNGQPHNDSKVRIVHLPPSISLTGWDISEYRYRWDLIEGKLRSGIIPK